jgi:hypothetical protein
MNLVLVQHGNEGSFCEQSISSLFGHCWVFSLSVLKFSAVCIGEELVYFHLFST